MSLMDAATLAFLTCAVGLTGCGTPAPELPADHIEAAATCYAAKVGQVAYGAMTADQANSAAHFLFLGAVNDGMGSPTALKKAADQGNALRDKIKEGGDTARYDAPCAKRFAPTVAGSFKELPADSRDTRMMCLTLSTSVMQMYQSSNVTPPPATAAMQARLDTSLMAEINSEGSVNPAEVAGLAMRSMAKAAELGPVTDVLGACAKRYGAA